MSRVRECFVCGALLAQTEKQRVEVCRRGSKIQQAEACAACWWTLRGKGVMKVTKRGRVFEVRVRRSQLELFKKTARRVMAGG